MRSKSANELTGSAITGVNDTSGGKAFGWLKPPRGFFLSGLDLLETFEVETGIEGRRDSVPEVL